MYTPLAHNSMPLLLHLHHGYFRIAHITIVTYCLTSLLELFNFIGTRQTHVSGFYAQAIHEGRMYDTVNNIVPQRKMKSILDPPSLPSTIQAFHLDALLL